MWATPELARAFLKLRGWDSNPVVLSVRAVVASMHARLSCVLAHDARHDGIYCEDLPCPFPEAASPRPGSHEKDRLENRLHDLVCSGQITLRRAQNAIATNWVKAYKVYVLSI
jgi:hypothetical protein